MNHRSKWTALLCLSCLLLSLASCSSDDDTIATRPLSADAAETILGGSEGVVLNAVNFTAAIGAVLGALVTAPATGGSRSVEQTCTNLSGLIGANLCVVPSDGQLCTLSATEAELRFTTCNALELGSTLDGTAQILNTAPDTYVLTFDLRVEGGGRIDDVVTFTLGGSCPVAAFDGLALISGGIGAVHESGSLEACSASDNDGMFEVSVDATGFEPFVAEISVGNGNATAAVRNAEGPLYDCTFDLVALTSECMDAGGSR